MRNDSLVASKIALVVLFLVTVGCTKKADPTAAPPPTAAASTMGTPLVVADAGERHHRRNHEDRHEAAEDSGVPLTVDVKIGDTTKTWRKDSFDKVTKFGLGSNANDGEARDTWSLRELARVLVGPNARVVTVVGPEENHPISPADWKDPTRTPILHTTRRGTLKFRWADAAGKWGDADVRDVTRLEIAP